MDSTFTITTTSGKNTSSTNTSSKTTSSTITSSETMSSTTTSSIATSNTTASSSTSTMVIKSIRPTVLPYTSTWLFGSGQNTPDPSTPLDMGSTLFTMLVKKPLYYKLPPCYEGRQFMVLDEEGKQKRRDIYNARKREEFKERAWGWFRWGGDDEKLGMKD